MGHETDSCIRRHHILPILSVSLRAWPIIIDLRLPILSLVLAICDPCLESSSHNGIDVIFMRGPRSEARWQMPRGEGARAKLPRFLYRNLFWVREVWFMSCKKNGMLFFECSSPTRLERISGLSNRICCWGRAVLVLFMIQHLPASDLLKRPQSRPESVAFARYIASLEEHDPYTEVGPVAVLIEASFATLS